MATAWFGLAAESDDGAAEAPRIIRSLSSKLPPTMEDGRLLSELRISSTRWVLDFLHSVASFDFLAVDIVEVAPPLDAPSSPTSLLSLKLILEILGGRLSR